jgi:hypothetical protein
MTTEQQRIESVLREKLPDIPLISRKEGERSGAGMNVYRFTRTDFPSRAYPANGTMIAVMSDPFGENPTLHAEWVSRVTEIITKEWPNRYRALLGEPSMFLIENSRTRWTQARRLARNRPEIDAERRTHMTTDDPTRERVRPDYRAGSRLLRRSLDRAVKQEGLSFTEALDIYDDALPGVLSAAVAMRRAEQERARNDL